jgi:hypothetical protein
VRQRNAALRRSAQTAANAAPAPSEDLQAALDSFTQGGLESLTEEQFEAITAHAEATLEAARQALENDPAAADPAHLDTLIAAALDESLAAFLHTLEAEGFYGPAVPPAIAAYQEARAQAAADLSTAFRLPEGDLSATIEAMSAAVARFEADPTRPLFDDLTLPESQALADAFRHHFPEGRPYTPPLTDSALAHLDSATAKGASSPYSLQPNPLKPNSRTPDSPTYNGLYELDGQYYLERGNGWERLTPDRITIPEDPRQPITVDGHPHWRADLSENPSPSSSSSPSSSPPPSQISNLQSEIPSPSPDLQELLDHFSTDEIENDIRWQIERRGPRDLRPEQVEYLERLLDTSGYAGFDDADPIFQYLEQLHQRRHPPPTDGKHPGPSPSPSPSSSSSSPSPIIHHPSTINHQPPPKGAHASSVPHPRIHPSTTPKPHPSTTPTLTPSPSPINHHPSTIPSMPTPLPKRTITAQAATPEISALQAKIDAQEAELAKLREQLAEYHQKEATAAAERRDAAIAAAIEDGRIPPEDEDSQNFWRQSLTASEALALKALAALPKRAPIMAKITTGSDTPGTPLDQAKQQEAILAKLREELPDADFQTIYARAKRDHPTAFRP